MNSIQSIFKLSYALVSSLTLLGCSNNKQTNANVLSTDQRPDISEDRTRVHITAGTKDFIYINAADLKALVSGIPHPDTGLGETLPLNGQFIFAVAQNPRTNLVAVGVRGLISYETDYSMVFVVNPAVPNKPQLVKFVMPGKTAAKDGSTPAFGTIRHMEFDSSGLLRIQHGNQSDASAEIVVDHALNIKSCKYLTRVSNNDGLCGENN